MMEDIGQGIVIIIGLIALGILAVWESFDEIVKVVRKKIMIRG